MAKPQHSVYTHVELCRLLTAFEPLFQYRYQCRRLQMPHANKEEAAIQVSRIERWRRAPGFSTQECSGCKQCW